MKPRIWQQQLIQLLRRRLNQSSDQGIDVLVHAGPGAGKTLGALLGVRKMKDEGRLSKCIIFTHRKTIKSQWLKTSRLVNLDILDFESIEENHQLPTSTDGWLVTYQAASRHFNLLKSLINSHQDNGLISIADEAHHLGLDPDEPEGQVWGNTFLDLTRNCRLRLGLTGTPFRADNLAFCSAKKMVVQSDGKSLEQITPDLCVEPKELIEVGDVRPLEFWFQDGSVMHLKAGSAIHEISNLSSENRESWRARNLRKAIRLSDSSSIAVHLLLKARHQLDKVRKKHSNAAGLVIAKDIDHAVSISNLLKEEGDRVDLIHSQESNASEKLSQFQKGNSDWLVSVDMCSEGFDAPRLRVVAYLTTVVTKSRFLQGITRAVRMCSTRSSLEAVPRDPSYIYAPADPLLINFARNWSISNPYLIQSPISQHTLELNTGHSRGPALPLKAVKAEAGSIITLRTAELPNFL